MADQISRFTPQNKTTNERLSTTTVGLVALSDFRKRRAEVLEQQEREAREAVFAGTSRPDRSQTGTPDGSDSADVAEQKEKKKKKREERKKPGKKLLSFDDDEGSWGDNNGKEDDTKEDKSTDGDKKGKLVVNAAVGIIPRAVTKAALRKEATEREALRREFVALQEAVKASEIAVPFVFYDGTNVPGGMVRVKKGDFVWVFLDKSRRVGAERVGEQPTALRAWARVGVDDLMLVRGTVIIPHHYDFYYFIMNRSIGPGGNVLFDYSADAPARDDKASEEPRVMVTAATKAAAVKALPDIRSLEGAGDDAGMTKVVDRRWYERHKHIYPASTWQKFDAEKDYAREIRKDTGGNTFFFAK